MKHNLVNFTRGSQLLGHFGFMFAAGLKGPLIVTVLVILGLGWLEVKSSLSDQEIYLIWMHLYASAYGFMEFDPDKLVNLKLGHGETAAFPMSVVTNFPPMREAVAAFGEALRSALGLSAIVLVPLFIAFWWIAERFGERSKRKKHVRGSSLAARASRLSQRQVWDLRQQLLGDPRRRARSPSDRRIVAYRIPGPHLL